MLLDRRQTPWALATIGVGVGVGVVAVGVYFWLDRRSSRPLTGGSTVGLWYGVAGSALMIYAGLLSAHRLFPAAWWSDSGITTVNYGPKKLDNGSWPKWFVAAAASIAMLALTGQARAQSVSFDSGQPVGGNGKINATGTASAGAGNHVSRVTLISTPVGGHDILQRLFVQQRCLERRDCKPPRGDL